MTTSELHTAFRLELDKTNSLSTTSFEPEEVDYWLNKAYLALVNQKMFGANPRGEGYDMSQKREDDLRKLIITNTVFPSKRSEIANGYWAYLSGLSNYLYMLSSRTIYSNGKQSVNYNISHNEKDRFIETSVNVPWIKNPVVYIENNEIFLLYDNYAATSGGYTVSALEVTYLRKPDTLAYTSPYSVPLIAEHVHPEIVSLAAFMAVENIESPRVQTNPLILNKLE